MNFSAWSIRNPIAPILGFVMLMTVGWQAFNSLPITRFPNIDIPLVAVTVVQSGAAPAEMESQITKEIEDALAGVNGVKNLISTVTDGVSTTVAEFRMEVPTEKAVQDSKDAIDRIIGNLPGGVESPVVTRIDVEGQAILTYAVTAPNMSIEELSWFVDDTITRALQGRPGIGRVDRYGGAEREVRVELDPLRLDSYGITASAVNAQLRATNTDLGAGRSELGQAEQAIRALGDASTVASLANTTIALPSGNFVKLGDLGTVLDTYQELRSFSRFNGEPVVTFAIFRAKGASEVSVAEIVKSTIEQLQGEHSNVNFKLVDDNVYFTYGNYEAALSTLIEGAILAVFVVFLFLRNWRATLISAVALPLSAIPTFWAMDMLGFSLNLISFLALTLATGILVDDAIVEIENIARHIRMGKSPYRAAMEAADEIGLAVIATTMTIIAVFVPVSFMAGVPGQYFRQFGLTVAISVFFSLLVARLITPMMAAYLMSAKDAEEKHSEDGIVMRGYLAIVRATMRRRYLTLLGAIGVLIVSVFFMARIPGSFIPPDDVGRISVSVELAPGSSLQDTDRITRQMYEAVFDIDGVENVFVLGGSSPTGDRDVRRAALTILLYRKSHSLVQKLADIGNSIPIVNWFVPNLVDSGRTIPQNLVEVEAFKRLRQIPDVRAVKLNDRGERDLSYSILSKDEESLNLGVSMLEAALRGDPALADVATEGALPRPELQITPRPEEAARLGITTRQIADVLRVATIGDIDAALAKLSIDNRLIPVRVRLNDESRNDLARISALMIPTAVGGSVPLSSVADVAIAQGPSTVQRFNRERRAILGANLPIGIALGTASAAFERITADVVLPEGVRIAKSGDAEVQQELTASFGKAMILGLMLVLSVLILLFKSVIQPFTIIFSLPLAIGGVAAALIITGSAVSMPVLIGILMLMGIVTKNAILLVDFAVEMRVQGLDRFTALVEAGHKRARPIVMTSIAMSAGMLPSALGVGEGGSFRAPMATAVIGGIIASTILSLVIVPSFFLIMDDLSNLLTKLFSRFIGNKEPEPDIPANEDLAEDIAGLSERLTKLEGTDPSSLGKWQAAE